MFPMMIFLKEDTHYANNIMSDATYVDDEEQTFKKEYPITYRSRCSRNLYKVR